ncbi:hypothetical protein EC973_000805 [Apophysomyces ossiformis]|uniref:WIBG Mago-binding domain-containing protein n=1 Tax=Apophysomyces ossiformis TaxID=679940 RepID=A0A8H7EPS7_9FUNG|nr:hypothetical protein EC973_000805 [Apophysomyces ossiformis]
MTEPSNAGIIQVGEDRWIPASRRADGSIRKERKVRPGFVPLEDVQRYTNARMQPKPASQYPPGYNPKNKAEVPGSKPKVKKVETERKTQKEAATKDEPSVAIEKTAPKETPAQQEQPSISEKTPEEKKIKAIQKKLRQISELEQKLIKGEQLNAEQHAKVQKGKSLREELAKLSLS